MLQVPESVAELGSEWVRFTTTGGGGAPPMVLELAVEIRGAPADPASWALSLVDQLTSQNAEELGTVQCGQPFVLEVEALDHFNNRCVSVCVCARCGVCSACNPAAQGLMCG